MNIYIYIDICIYYIYNIYTTPYECGQVYVYTYIYTYIN